MISEAINYLKLGFPVIPLKKDKRPYLKTWKEFQDIRPTQEQVEGWWRKWPKANIGLVCGKLSGIMVIDIDSQDAKESIEEMLPDSLSIPTSITPNHGWHLYFKFKEGLCGKNGVFPNIDLQYHGNYVVAPPSYCEYEKHGNAVKGKYSWLNGSKLSDVNLVPDVPSFLFDILLNACILSNNTISNNYIRENDDSEKIECRQESPLSSNVVNFYREGRRDEDIFHAANCLIKGGAEKDFIYKTLELLSKSCTPPFPEKEIPVKLQSALNRKESRDGNLTADIREFILSSNGVILSSNVAKCLHLSSRNEQKHLSKVLKRLCDDEKLIEKSGNRHGEYRVIDQSCKPMDWQNADQNYIPLWLPIGLDQIAGVLPGNIIVFAGAKDSGKSSFCMNIAKENRHKYEVHYFNSEMGPAEFKMRASKFDDIHVSQWNNVNVYERSDNFHDVIRPGEGNLNIIDFLEAPDEVWKVGSWIQKIHNKLNGALCVIALQKKIGVDLGRGAEFSMEKARLYISLDYGRAKIISCKNFLSESPIGNPRGYQCFYKLVGGAKIIKDHNQGWHRPPEKGEK